MCKSPAMAARDRKDETVTDSPNPEASRLSQSELAFTNPLYFFLHKDAKITKLVTKEDPYMLHKTLGFLSVLSFIYRYYFVYNMKGNLGFDGTLLDWATLTVHTLLAFSSIIFRVPRKRIDRKPMIIYEEYRQHAMIFTFRCFSVSSIAMYYHATEPAAPIPRWVLPVAVMLHHLFVDDVTHRHGSGNTAVRAQSKKLKTSSFYKNVGYLYSYYQFLAIGSHINPSLRVADMGYNAIVAIQSSAFLMTLYRKRIIRGRTHMAVYSFCLILSAFHIARTCGFVCCFLAACTFALRINLPRHWGKKVLNIWDPMKYLCWTLFCFCSYFLHSQYGVGY